MSLIPEMMPAWELQVIVKNQAARIEQLEAALRKLTDRLEEDFSGMKPLRRYELEKARAALTEAAEQEKQNG